MGFLITKSPSSKFKYCIGLQKRSQKDSKDVDRGF